MEAMTKVNYGQADTNGLAPILGFYPDVIQYPSIPEPTIEIDDDTHLDCINNQGLRKVDVKKLRIVSCAPPEPDPIDTIKIKIMDLEAQQTPRRYREAMLGVEEQIEQSDGSKIGWMQDTDNKIAILRQQLQDLPVKS
jgi:hypothetical protein